VVIKKGSVEKSQLSEAGRVQLKKNSFELVVENWVRVLEMAVEGDDKK
jgi:hypothetical protein